MSSLRWSSGATTDVGNFRDRNEDAVLARPQTGLWAVADGMGGHERGDVASRLAIDSLPASAPPVTLNERIVEVSDAITAANQTLIEQAADGEVCGTTIVAATVVNGLLACLWVGDSRAYLLREGKLEQITRDHTELQELLDAGPEEFSAQISQDSAHVLTRAIGSDPRVAIDCIELPLADGDVLLLCSDGLYGELDNQTLQRHLEASDSPSHTARRLVQDALRGECMDNVSAVVVQFENWD